MRTGRKVFREIPSSSPVRDELEIRSVKVTKNKKAPSDGSGLTTRYERKKEQVKTGNGYAKFSLTGKCSRVVGRKGKTERRVLKKLRKKRARSKEEKTRG